MGIDPVFNCFVVIFKFWVFFVLEIFTKKRFNAKLDLNYPDFLVCNTLFVPDCSQSFAEIIKLKTFFRLIPFTVLISLWTLLLTVTVQNVPLKIQHCLKVISNIYSDTSLPDFIFLGLTR